jgi:hypothetical protein
MTDTVWGTIHSGMTALDRQKHVSSQFFLFLYNQMLVQELPGMEAIELVSNALFACATARHRPRRKPSLCIRKPHRRP